MILLPRFIYGLLLNLDVKKNPELIKGIPLHRLKRIPKITTTEEKVLEFLEKHPKEGFTIDLFAKAGFSTNIRKIIQKLVDQEKVIQSSFQESDKKKWEYVYYLKPISSSFELKKTPEGWKLTQININGHYFLVDCDFNVDNNQAHIRIQFPVKGDGLIFSDRTDDEEDWSWVGSTRYSEMSESISDLKREIHILQDIEDFWEFDVISEDGKRTRISKTKSVIEGEQIELWAGNAGFLFEIDTKIHEVSILPIYRELDGEGNVILDDDEDEEDDDYDEDDYEEDEDDEPTFDKIVLVVKGHDEEEDDDWKNDTQFENSIRIPDANSITVKARK
jgi:hypothetical protein